MKTTRMAAGAQSGSDLTRAELHEGRGGEDRVTGAEDTRAAWDRIAPGYSRAVSPTHLWLGREGLRRAGLRPGMRFLDVAAGSGALSIPAAQSGARVLATDQSPVMLEMLRTRAREEKVELATCVMDGHALELDDNSFDMTGSQFGVMLFPDMPKGIRELVRVVKPGGRVLMSVYGDMRKIEFFKFFVDAMRSVRPGFEGPSPEQPPLPFQLQDPERLRRELSTAGLKDITVDTLTENLKFRTGKEIWEWLRWSNPIVATVLNSAGITNGEIDGIEQALEKMIRERAGARDAAILGSPINIGIGTK